MRFLLTFVFILFLLTGCREKISADYLCEEHFLHIEGSQKEVTADIYSYNETALPDKPEMSFLLPKIGLSYEKETESGKKIIVTINKDSAEFTKWSKNYKCRPVDRKNGKSEFSEETVLQFSKAHLSEALNQVLKSKSSSCGLNQNKKDHLQKTLQKSEVSVSGDPKKEELFLFDRYIFEGTMKIPAEEDSTGEFFTCAVKKKYLFNTKCLKFVKRKTVTSNPALVIPFTAVFSVSRYKEVMPTESYFYFNTINGKESGSNLSKFFCDSIIPNIQISEKTTESTVLK